MKTVVISLGGSLIVPNEIDINFLKNFKKIIEKFIKKDYRFVIICGGGKLARTYQNALSGLGVKDNSPMDWMGIGATALNAHLIAMMFGDKVYADVIYDPTKKIKSTKKIIIAAGWKPGWSTDYDAVLLARNLKCKSIINMSNIDYVYNKDPNKYSNAKKINNICWAHFRKLVGKTWKAGLSMPFDPVATKEAQKSKLKVFVIGNNLKNFENLLSNKKFNGTVIY